MLKVRQKFSNIKLENLGISVARDDFLKLLKGCKIIRNVKLLVFKKCNSGRNKIGKKHKKIYRGEDRNTKGSLKPNRNKRSS